MKITRVILIIIMIALFVYGCFEKENLTPELKKLNNEIKNEIIQSSCSNSLECRTIAFGDKACGGPEEYLIYSAIKTDENKLKSKVERYNVLDERRDREEGLASTCDVPSRPQVQCIEEKCSKINGMIFFEIGNDQSSKKDSIDPKTLKKEIENSIDKTCNSSEQCGKIDFFTINCNDYSGSILFSSFKTDLESFSKKIIQYRKTLNEEFNCNVFLAYGSEDVKCNNNICEY